MGYKLMDKFSLLHLSVGIIFYFWNVSFILSFITHGLFEYFENTNTGMKIINNLFVGTSPFTWPGRKDQPDTITNIFGDQLFFMIGWIIAYYVSEKIES
jgi:hypothetical protein